jgi:hypothetical protein
MMYKLNLPECDFRLKKDEGKVWIFDSIRKKFVVLTPEEWVRQHFVNYLISEKNIPRSLIRIEGGLLYNELQKRTDIVVYDRTGQPWLIVECKSPTIAVSPTTLEQATIYNSTLRAAYICITNGLVHLCANIQWEERTSIQIKEIPCYPGLGEGF